MLARDRQTNQFKKVYVKALDSMPVGSEIDFDGTSANIPVGWEEVTNPDSYSTDEIKTNKVWIDGKPIYRKAFSLTSGNVTHNIDNLGIITYLYGSYIRQDGIKGTIPRVSSVTDYVIAFGDISNTTINVNIGSGYSGTQSIVNEYVIIEYTKTTD